MNAKWKVALVAAAALFLSACGGKSRKPTYPVTGKVVFGQTPAARATLVFHPVAGDEPDVPRPRATVNDDGTFKVTTYDTGDGAPEGEYRVTVEWWLHSGRRDDESPPSNRLHPRYSQPTSSGIVARVEKGPTELKTIELRR